MSLPPSLEDLRSEIDTYLHTFLQQRRSDVPEASALIDEIQRVVGAGGKRLRPAFCYWGFRAAGGSHCDEIVHLASAFELLHTFAIVHDDIMDASSERRGAPSTVELLGLSQALLVGDLALVLADAAFWGSGFRVGLLCHAFAHFTKMREQVIAGQHLDVMADENTDRDRARLIARLKSGSYSIEHPLLIGARLAQASPSLLAKLQDFGRPLGEAFQLRDDLLGLFGDPSRTGKPTDSDIREGKRHVPYALTVANLQGAQRDDFIRLWGGGSDLGEEDVALLRDQVETAGAREETETLVATLTEEAAAALAAMKLQAEPRRALEQLMEATVTRTH